MELEYQSSWVSLNVTYFLLLRHCFIYQDIAFLEYLRLGASHFSISIITTKVVLRNVLWRYIKWKLQFYSTMFRNQWPRPIPVGIEACLGRWNKIPIKNIHFLLISEKGWNTMCSIKIFKSGLSRYMIEEEML